MDRNSLPPVLTLPKIGSLSARRAWIEMLGWLRVLEVTRVALRKESVDRNILLNLLIILFIMVALRKESVDRNAD